MDNLKYLVYLAKDAKTPEELYEAIGEVVDQIENDVNGIPDSVVDVYIYARRIAIRLRESNPDLPPLPPTETDPFLGLQTIQEWCIQPAKPAARDDAARRRLEAKGKVHLRDIIGALNPAYPHIEGTPKDDLASRMKRREEIEHHLLEAQKPFNLLCRIIADSGWDGEFDVRTFKEYAAFVALGAYFDATQHTDQPPFDNEHAQYEAIDEQVRRLHNSGLTATVLAKIVRKYPDVAKATGLSKASAAAAGSRNPPSLKESSPVSQNLNIAANYGNIVTSTTGNAKLIDKGPEADKKSSLRVGLIIVIVTALMSAIGFLIKHLFFGTPGVKP